MFCHVLAEEDEGVWWRYACSIEENPCNPTEVVKIVFLVVKSYNQGTTIESGGPNNAQRHVCFQIFRFPIARSRDRLRS